MLRIRTFWMRFRIFIFPLDFRNKYEFFGTVGSSVHQIKNVLIRATTDMMLLAKVRTQQLKFLEHCLQKEGIERLI